MQGQDEAIDDMVNAITKEMESTGVVLEEINRLGRREFAHMNHAKQKAGYYVQYHFEAEPAAVDEVEAKLKLNDNVMLQHYRRRP